MSDGNPQPGRLDAIVRATGASGARDEGPRHLRLVSGTTSSSERRETRTPGGLQRRGDLLAAMSHEIRTPLNAVMGYIELLETSLAGPLTDVQRDYLERMRTGTDRLAQLVGDLLDYVRLEAGDAQVEHRRAVGVRGRTDDADTVPEGSAAVGAWLGASVDLLVVRLVEALHREPGVQKLGLLSDAQLKDHLPSLLAGIAQSLVILAEAPGDPSLSIRDGIEILRLVADRHGAQRYRIGWVEKMVRREYELLRRIVADGVSAMEGVGAASLRTLDEFFDYAERTSIEGHRLAREALERA